MSGILIRWVVTTLAVVLVPYVVSGVKIEGTETALIAGAILGILNALVRPVLIILTLPLSIVTLGLFLLVINALMFQLAGAIVPGLHVTSFWSAFFGAGIVSIVSWLANWIIAGGAGERTVVVKRWDTHTIDLRRDQGDRWQ
ncbi:MAG: phage holin family protein [Pseudomonadota bacterium]